MSLDAVLQSVNNPVLTSRSLLKYRRVLGPRVVGFLASGPGELWCAGS